MEQEESMMHKMLLLTATLMLSANAQASYEFMAGGIDRGQLLPDVTAQTYITKKGNISVSIVLPDSSCYIYEEYAEPTETAIVNGRSVRMSQHCLEYGLLFVFPTTLAGSKYVVGQFKSKSKVSYLFSNDTYPVTFSAIGFTKAYNKEKKWSNPL